MHTHHLPPAFAPVTKWTFALSCALLALAFLGCKSVTKPGSAAFASVDITNHTSAEIIATTIQVFDANGYRGGQAGQDRMIFEKEASRGTTFSRDGLAAALAGVRTIYRFRLEIVPLRENVLRLQGDAFVVSGAGDPFFEDETRLTTARSGPYQKLLNKVAADLK